MFQLIKSSFIEQKLLSVYTDINDTSMFSIGFVMAYDNQQIILGSVDKHGYYDGYLAKSIEDIFLIEYDTLYSNRLLKLYKKMKQEHTKIKNINDISLYENILSFAKEYKKVVSVQLAGSSFNDAQGFVNEINDESVIVEKLSDDGVYDGLAIFPKNCITNISCDSKDEAAIMMLAENLSAL